MKINNEPLEKKRGYGVVRYNISVTRITILKLLTKIMNILKIKII